MDVELVMTTNAVVQMDQPRTGAVMGPVDDDPERVWLDLNIMGSHLPQMYRRSELEPATRELCQAHELCAECLGYGGFLEVDDKGAYRTRRCDECRGSGSSRYYVEISQNADGSVVEGRVIPRD